MTRLHESLQLALTPKWPLRNHKIVNSTRDYRINCELPDGRERRDGRYQFIAILAFSNARVSSRKNSGSV